MSFIAGPVPNIEDLDQATLNLIWEKFNELEIVFRGLRDQPFEELALLNLHPASWTPGKVFYVPDENGGETLVFSDGADWRRVQDRAVAS